MGSRKGIPNQSTEEKALKTERLNLRAAPGTIKKLDWIREHSKLHKGKSVAEIFAYLVDEHVGLQMLWHDDLPKQFFR